MPLKLGTEAKLRKKIYKLQTERITSLKNYQKNIADCPPQFFQANARDQREQFIMKLKFLMI
ncbi:hypothetical protein HZS_4537 [Henneguya salminicola]|nr:hypothetical protein HZS_4537 [Henneguya salminicola]